MLFRRISEHLNQQNWFAVAIDFVVVVLGIFIGMQVSDWNQLRLDKATELRYLIAIQSDLVETAAGITVTNSNLREIQQSLLVLAELAEGDPANYPKAELDRMIAKGLWDLAILEVQMDAYEDLKSSVGTKLLGSQPLRLGLSRLNALTDRYRHSETNSTQVQLINIDHYLADNFPMRQFNRVFENAKGLPDLKSENAPDYAEFISRQETQNRITMKYISITNQLTTLVGPSNLVSELRVLLSQRLGELGESQGSE